MSKIALSRSVVLVLEMVKACLAQTEPEYGLQGVWVQADIDTEVNPKAQYTWMEVYIENSGSKFGSRFHNVVATCRADIIGKRNPDGVVELNVADRRNGRPYDDPRWEFKCRLTDDHQIEVTRTK